MTLVHATLELDAATSALARVLKSLDLAADGDATVIAAVSRLAVAHRRHVLAQVVAMVGAGAAL